MSINAEHNKNTILTNDNPRYDMKDPENPVPITSTDVTSEVYIVSKEEGSSKSVELNLANLGYRPVPLACYIKFVHPERSELEYVDQQQTTLKRTGWFTFLSIILMCLNVKADFDVASL